jgi:hypothetical protein
VQKLEGTLAKCKLSFVESWGCAKISNSKFILTEEVATNSQVQKRDMVEIRSN